VCWWNFVVAHVEHLEVLESAWIQLNTFNVVVLEVDLFNVREVLQPL
jgi:hypothetical protein